jgi:hypothetical protein
MKTITMVVPLLWLAASSGAAAPDAHAAERTTVPLSDPSKAVRLKVHTINGGITVKGYDGKDVIVEVRTRDKAESGEGGGRYAGMKRLPNPSTGLSVEEENNVVTVNTESWRAPADLVIQVPTHASLELGCINDGDIVVEHVEGEIEAQNVNGAITLTGISGSALANTTNGAVTASFARLDPGKAMSFVTLNGNVEVTLPASTRADLNLKIDQQGDIFTDFDIATQAPRPASTEPGSRGKDGRYVLKVDRAVRGAINGGGPVMTLKTFNGDIVLHASK